MECIVCRDQSFGQICSECRRIASEYGITLEDDVMSIAITSKTSHHGNGGNMKHVVSLGLSNSTYQGPSPVNLSFSNHYRDGEEYDFNISREAAIELMLALDVILEIEE